MPGEKSNQESSKNEEQPEQAASEIKEPQVETELSPKEKLKKVWELARHLRQIFSISPIYGTEDYTLIGAPVGSAITLNSFHTARQFEFALALSLNPLVEEFAQQNVKFFPEMKKRIDLPDGGYQITIESSPESKKQFEKFETGVKNLIENQVMKGLKILDLGCGSKPTFARAARAAGADVYTVDIFGADGFEYDDRKEIDPEIIRYEIKKHIKLDLNDPNAVKILQERTGGNFDLVTEANLHTGGATAAFHEGKKIAWPLLKPGGIHFDANKFDKTPDIKERK